MQALAQYTIVGAGSAGCVLAGELARAGRRVLLLEAGPPASSHPHTLQAHGFGAAFADDALMFHRMSTPASPGERPVFVGTGRGMGGSGSVNGMVYTRPDAGDFDHWPATWSWKSVCPAFEAIEKRLQPRPLPATPFIARFVAGAQAIGLKHRDGMVDGRLRNVVGCNSLNHDGVRRNSSYRLWVHDDPPAGLTVLTDCRVRRIVLVQQAGQWRASGLEIERAGRRETLPVEGELVLCAGALETPRLLMLSGLGPAAVLQRAGVSVVCDLPGVGRDLKDHPNVPVFFRGVHPVDFSFPQVYAFDAVAPRLAGNKPSSGPSDICYVCYSPPSSLRESMLRMLPVLALPGRLHGLVPLRRLLQSMIRLAFTGGLLQRWLQRVFAVVVILGKPRSVGHIDIVSPDPDVPARIVPAYLSDPEDQRVFDHALTRALQLVAQGPLAGSRLLSGAAASASSRRRWRWIRGSMLTTYHFCGSCRMGDSPDAPVDATLRLRGAQNIWVADASVLPEIPVCATNATSMMVGYRAAEFLLKGNA